MTAVVGVSTSVDGTVWCVDAAGKMHIWLGRDGATPGWQTNQQGIAVQVAVGNYHDVWCRNAAGGLFKLGAGDPASAEWQPIPFSPGTARSVSVGFDGTVWAVANDEQGRPYSRQANGMWVGSTNGKDVRQISVGDRVHACCVNTQSLLFGLDSDQQSWVPNNTISNVKSVSVARDGTLWAVQNNNALFRREPSANAWVPEGSAEMVSVMSANEAGTVSQTGQIQRWVSGTWELVPSP